MGLRSGFRLAVVFGTTCGVVLSTAGSATSQDGQPASSGPDVRISELTNGGPGGHLDNFIEIANFGDEVADLEGWRIFRCAATGSRVYDPQVPPLLDYRYLTDPFDRERMRKAIRLAVRMAADPAFKDLVIERVLPTDADLASDEALDDWLMRNLGTSHHVSGTCKMGPASDPMAVVNQYGRVHGLDGLWVADASIMPDCIRANTNATTIMIGERVADFIKAGR
jgi:choline dehydrogenase-like flavoprotein